MPKDGRKTMQRRLGWVACAALDTADISLRDAALLGQLNLGETPLHPSIPELKPKHDASGESLPERSVLRGVGSLGLGQVVTELGSHSRPSSARLVNDSSMCFNTCWRQSSS